VPWVKFTDDWYDDEDMADASPLAIAMWAVAITWSARNLTDGRIPRSQVRKFLDLEHEVLVGASCRADDVAAELVRLGKWTASDRGFTICNYHRYQPTREQVVAQREARAAAGRKGAEARWQSDGKCHSNGHGKSMPPSPVPDGDLVSRRPGNSRGPAEPVDDDEISINGTVPDEVWERYAQLKLQRQPPGKVENTVSWKRTTARNARVELGEKAHRWWVGYQGITPYRLAQCLIDDAPPRDLPFTVPAAS
jgi:hypothetical protein